MIRCTIYYRKLMSGPVDLKVFVLLDTQILLLNFNEH